ncbi:hypothetical protein AB0M22_37350 [Nocardia sp. NPDC051756]|uniref:hypothetical protein n=1 Tax=Nocardia sp. NPDC051756 TaxID=3154751 RepID=UPI003446E0F6
MIRKTTALVALSLFVATTSIALATGTASAVPASISGGGSQQQMASGQASDVDKPAATEPANGVSEGKTDEGKGGKGKDGKGKGKGGKGKGGAGKGKAAADLR